MTDAAPINLFARSFRLVRQAVELHREGSDRWVAALPALRALTLLAEAALRAEGRPSADAPAGLRELVESAGEAGEPWRELVEAIGVCQEAIDVAGPPSAEQRERLAVVVERLPRTFTDTWRRTRQRLFSPLRRLFQVALVPLTAAAAIGILFGVYLLWPQATAPEGPAPQEDCQIQVTYFAGSPRPGHVAHKQRVCHIDFDWGEGRPTAGVPSEDFSAVFFGNLSISERDNYTFHLKSHGQARVEVDNKVVINRRGEAEGDESSGTLLLHPGEKSLRVVFRDTEGEAAVRLQWTSSRFRRQLITSELMAGL